MRALLNNFQAFIARAGFRLLQVPDTPQEYVGQHLLYAYLDHFVRVVGADMFLEVRTGRGRMDLLVLHNQRKYIVETKIWEGDRSYQAGKRQLAAYLKLEGVTEGYYVVFDHRQNPEPRVETPDDRQCGDSELCYSCHTKSPVKQIGVGFYFCINIFRVAVKSPAVNV